MGLSQHSQHSGSTTDLITGLITKAAITRTLLFALLASMILLAPSAFALPVNLEEIRVDDFAVFENQVNRLDVQRNAEHFVDIRFTPTQDMRNAELELFVSGFEYKDLFPIRDSTGIFDADANVSYIKRLSFTLSDEVDEDDY